MLNTKIKQELDRYLEFNSEELFSFGSSNFKYSISIFGGAIRDIIADQKINDVDILLSSKSHVFVESVLRKNGYKFFEKLNGKDLQEMYSEIHVISEPHTWMKGEKVIQLIRPSINSKSELDYQKEFSNLISNVDLSCCGVSWVGSNLHEDYPNALLHCQSKVFSVNKNAKMYSQRRINHRIHKLKERGWVEIENTDATNRDLKIKLVI